MMKNSNVLKKTRYVTRYNPLQNVTAPGRYRTLAKNAVPSNKRFWSVANVTL